VTTDLSASEKHIVPNNNATTTNAGGNTASNDDISPEGLLNVIK
jgi:hypothetical protein